MTVQERVKPAEVFKPEVASLNMGSMNFGLFPMLNRFKSFKHDWEAQALENSRDLVFRNTYKDIEFVLRTLGDAGTRFEFECYDTAHLYNLAHFLERGLVKPPLFVQTVFGILGGIGPHPEDVLHMKRTADRLFGTHYKWSVLGAGRNQLAIAAQAAAMGGNVRVGLEDSLVVRARATREQQRRAGAGGAPDRRRSRPFGRQPRRGARNLANSRAATGSLSEAGSSGGLRHAAHRASDRRPRRTRRGPAVGRRRAATYWIDSLGAKVHSCDAQRRRRRAVGTCPSTSAPSPCARRAARSFRCETVSTRSISRPARAASSLIPIRASRVSA